MRSGAALDPWIREAFSALDMPEEMAWHPTVDLTDMDHEFILTVELPGVKPEDVDLSLEGGALTIKGEKKEERESETRRRRVFERSYGSFERSFTLPRSVDPDQVSAEFENGVLTVHLPKNQEATGRRIEIQSNDETKSKGDVQSGEQH